jgi:universal stress protein A
MQDDLPNRSPGEIAVSHERPQGATDGADPGYAKVLVPIDFSEHSKRTVAYATRTAIRNNSTVYLLHVFQVPDYVVTPYARRKQRCTEVQSQVDAAELEARENLTLFAEELSNKGVNVQPYLRVGYPFDEIVQTANHFDVDLIIIGSHGRSRVSRLLVGSTAERVVAHARCPVLVVKGERLE